MRYSVAGPLRRPQSASLSMFELVRLCLKGLHGFCLCLKGAYQSQVRHGVRLKIALRKLNHQTNGALGVIFI
jgi:hypothetical protein